MASNATAAMQVAILIGYLASTLALRLRTFSAARPKVLATDSHRPRNLKQSTQTWQVVAHFDANGTAYWRKWNMRHVAGFVTKQRTSGLFAVR